MAEIDSDEDNFMTSTISRDQRAIKSAGDNNNHNQNNNSSNSNNSNNNKSSVRDKLKYTEKHATNISFTSIRVSKLHL